MFCRLILSLDCVLWAVYVAGSSVHFAVCPEESLFNSCYSCCHPFLLVVYSWYLCATNSHMSVFCVTTLDEIFFKTSTPLCQQEPQEEVSYDFQDLKENTIVWLCFVVQSFSLVINLSVCSLSIYIYVCC